MSSRRSPYLILGVPYGASKSDAARAFAKASRRIRKSPDAPYDIEDLNWALHAVEQRVEDPATSIDDYRMPANANVYVIPAGVGILNPHVDPYPRQTHPATPSDLDAVRSALIYEVASDLVKEFENVPLPTLHKLEEGR